MNGKHEYRDVICRWAWLPTALCVALSVLFEFRGSAGMAYGWFRMPLIALIATPLVWRWVAGRGAWPLATSALSTLISGMFVLLAPTADLLSDFARPRVEHDTLAGMNFFVSIAAGQRLGGVAVGELCHRSNTDTTAVMEGVGLRECQARRE